LWDFQLEDLVEGYNVQGYLNDTSIKMVVGYPTKDILVGYTAHGYSDEVFIQILTGYLTRGYLGRIHCPRIS
jgi:hypothetical protein